jgi:MFS family permease
LEAALKLELNGAAGATIPADIAEVKASVDPIVSGRLSRWGGLTSMMINIGAFFGMFGFGALSQRIGRKPTFAIGFLAAFASTATVFGLMHDFSEIFWMVPIMGFCQLSLFAGYAIYFPELFPTYLRSTGTSFCYNVGRFIAATGPLIQAELIKTFASKPESLRYAGVTMCTVFLIGLLVLPFLPETKGQPLPE